MTGAVVIRFLDNACPDHHVRGGQDHIRAENTAMRLLLRFPGVAHASFCTSVVCGDLAAVTRALAADPGLATRVSSPAGAGRTGGGGEGDLEKRDWGEKGWEPISFLCFTRLPLRSVEANAIAIARLLLDHGANPNAHFPAGGSSYTPLTGVIGEGEEGRPGHQCRDELVKLLLDRGADPYDAQVIYNIHFKGRVLWFLRMIHGHTTRGGRGRDWHDPEWSMLNAGNYGSGARWFLETAVEHNDLELTEWCLTHHANPNSPPGPGRRDRQRTLYDEAVFRGHRELAELLARYGAKRSTLKPDPIETLVSACLNQNSDRIRAEIARCPEFLQRPEPLFACAKFNRIGPAALLLDLGTSPDVESPEGERALHYAAYDDSIDIARLLVERGAEVDAIGRQYDNTPLGGALHCSSKRVIEYLSGVSRSTWEVAYAGNVDHLHELLRERPERARGYDGETLLMYLPPASEETALEVAALLLEHGADPRIKDPDGQTAADRAERNAMFRVAELLRSRE